MRVEGEIRMSGKTIGKTLNQLPDIIWEGSIEIQRVNNEHSFRFLQSQGDSRVDSLVREHLGGVVRALDEAR
jgi:hypothetical protein